jgi:hypothetical protein
MKRARQYFFTPGTNKLFLTGNKPNQKAFQDLMDSTPFFNEIGDTASASQQGLVKIATDADVMSRTSAGSSAMQTVVRPHQLPTLAGTTEVLTSTPQSLNGIKITADVSGTRTKYSLAFDPTTIAAKSSVVDADSVLISDSADSGKAKTVLVSLIKAGTGLWNKTAGWIVPATANDPVDLGTGLMKAGEIQLTWAANVNIKPERVADSNGAHLKISGGDGYTAGGTSYVGGNLLLIPGSGQNGGASGETRIGYDTAKRGKVGIGVPADTDYFCTVSDTKALLVSGEIKLMSQATVTTLDFLTGLDSSGIFKKITAKNIIIGAEGQTGSQKSIIWWDGTDFQKVVLTADKYLRFDGTNVVASDLVIADSAIALSKLANPVYTKTETDSIASGLNGLITAISKNVIDYSKLGSGTTTLVAADIKPSHTLDSAGGLVTCNLPLISTLQDGQVVEFNLYGANHAVIGANAADSFLDWNGTAEASSINMTNAGAWRKLRCDHATKIWSVIGYSLA